MSSPHRDLGAPVPAGRRSVGVVEVIVSAGLSAAIALLAWRVWPSALQRPLDIVGYPSFHGFDYKRQFLSYRLVVWAFPISFFAILSVAARVRGRGVPGHGLVPPKGTRAPAHEEDDRSSLVAAVAQIGLTVAVVATAVSATSPTAGVTIDANGLVAGLGYAAVIVAVCAIRLRGRQQGVSSTLVAANGLAAIVVTPSAIWLFARSSTAALTSGHIDRFTWLPAWCPLVVVGAVAGRAVSARRRGDSLAQIGAWTTRWLSAPALIFIVTASLPGQILRIEGFDDMQSVTGADLVTRGYVPWRDFMFVHGLFEDALRSLAGFELFEHTLWGSQAASGLLWVPLGWIGLYLLGAQVTGRRLLPLLPVFVFLIWMSQRMVFPVRWVVAAYVFALLGQSTRKHSLGWTVALTAGLFVQAVLVPEAVFQLAAVVVAILASDLSNRTPGQRWLRSLRRTRAFAVTGAILSGAWLILLGQRGAARGFIDYYLIFGPGHAQAGSLPIGPYVSATWFGTFCAGTALVVLTLIVVSCRLVQRGKLTETSTLMLACALFAGLYGEKALGRFDDPHVQQSVAATLPLAVLWLAVGTSRLQEASTSASRQAALSGVRLLRLLPVAIVVAGMLPATATAAWHAPGRIVANVSGHRTPGIGYSAPAAIDATAVADLRSVVHSLGHDAPVFDFTNSPGVVHFLVGADPATTYFHVSMAISPRSQLGLVGQLRRRPPPLVLYDSTEFGLPSWDRISNPVRHYLVADFILSHWTPVLRTHGVLVMLRNDLAGNRPDIPRLTEPPITTGLDTPACDWGLAAAYLASKPAGDSVPLTVGTPATMRRVTVDGWAYDPTTGDPADEVLVRVGGQEVGELPVTGLSRDVTARTDVPGAVRSRFEGDVITSRTGRIEVVAVTSAGRRTLTRRAAAGAKPSELAEAGPTGRLDHVRESTIRVAKVEVPRGARLSDYRLATFHTSGASRGRAPVTLTDAQGARGASAPLVRAAMLPGARSLAVRVGSCLAWRGFTPDDMYVVQEGGPPIDRITLSGVS